MMIKSYPIESEEHARKIVERLTKRYYNKLIIGEANITEELIDGQWNIVLRIIKVN